jgi:hypothetical protein
MFARRAIDVPVLGSPYVAGDFACKVVHGFTSATAAKPAVIKNPRRAMAISNPNATKRHLSGSVIVATGHIWATRGGSSSSFSVKILPMSRERPTIRLTNA